MSSSENLKPTMELKKRLFSHKELCEIGAKWASRSKSQSGPGCLFSVCETKTGYTGEAPDVIGWRVAYGPEAGFDSILIECKATTADFYADAKKPFRIDPSKGVGVYRYFLAPKGVIPIDRLPKNWGLIEVNERGHIKVLAGHVLAKYADEHLWRFQTNQHAEHSILCATLCRVSDPQKIQNQIREKNNQIAKLAAALQRERSAHEETKSQYLQLRHNRN